MQYRLQNCFGSFLAGFQISGERVELFFSDVEEEAYLFTDEAQANNVCASAGGFLPLQVEAVAA
jgi:hypothetical protein